MAKELPYFKFEPAEYLTKDISFCSLSAQGLFINICSYYWQRNCKLTKDQLLKRLNYETELNELISEGVIDLKDNIIVIKFLDNQLVDVSKTSNKNSINGSKGGRPKKAKQNPKETQNKPNGFNSLSETKGIREDKIIEDEIRKENIIEDEFDTEKNLDIDILKNHYLKSTKILNAVIGNKINNLIDENDLKVKLDKFHNSLIETGSLKKSFSEYAIYFRNWCKTKQFEKLKPKKQEPVIPSRGFSL